MKYAIQVFDKHDAGETQLLLKADVFVEIAIIPWKQGETSTVFLHPTNIAGMISPTPVMLKIATNEKMPVLTADELKTVLDTVQTQTKQIQSENRRTMTKINPLMPPPN